MVANLLVDSHCHLDCIELEEFNQKFDNLIQSAQDKKVTHFLCVSINLNNYPSMLKKVEGYDNISVSVGMHPCVDATNHFSKQELINFAQGKKVVAIGETGLDYYYHKDKPQWQQQRFREHIQVANTVNKPLIIHTREAGEDTLKILTEENAAQCKGVIHCFTENQAFAEKAMEMGFMISFSGIVTFKNATQLQKVAENIPDDKLLIETDAPYLSPKPYRGRQNQPAYVYYVAEKLAEIRKTSIEHIAEITTNNYFRLFGHHP